MSPQLPDPFPHLLRVIPNPLLWASELAAALRFQSWLVRRSKQSVRQTARQPNHWSESRGRLLSAVFAGDVCVCVRGGASQELTGQLQPKQERDLMLMHACVDADGAPDVVLCVWNSILRHCEISDDMSMETQYPLRRRICTFQTHAGEYKGFFYKKNYI